MFRNQYVAIPAVNPEPQALREHPWLVALLGLALVISAEWQLNKPQNSSDIEMQARRLYILFSSIMGVYNLMKGLGYGFEDYMNASQEPRAPGPRR